VFICEILTKNHYKGFYVLKIRYFLLCICVCILTVPICAQEGNVPSEKVVLPLDQFLRLAAEKDTEFEQILIDEMNLQYQKALQIPPEDLILSVKQQHEFFLDQDRTSPETSVSLSKLFARSGTQIDAGYEAGASITSAAISSEAFFNISQPIARNAFGHSTRLLDKMIGLEVDVARHQIVEAYEDYLAVIINAYYSWYEDYENLKVGKSSYQSNLQLLDNILDRQKKKIALPLDVNKVKLQVMAKQERLISLEEQYKKSLNAVKRIIRQDHGIQIFPANAKAVEEFAPDFKSSFKAFQEESRTFEVLTQLQEKSSLQVARDANDLLPSIDLLLGYEVKGKKYSLDDENNYFYAGMQIDWPFGNQVDRADYEVAKIQGRKRELALENTYHQLYVQLLNLALELEREKQLIEIADERIDLAESVVSDETENYSFGKVSLNDYIQSVNVLDANRFNKITHESLHKKLLVEWMRLTDKLVQNQEYLSSPF